jgi:hypothetical protein
LDQNNQVDPGYTGKIHFTSSGAAANLPADYTFTAADHGAHTFKATALASGSLTLTADDLANPSIKGSDIVTATAPAYSTVISFDNVASGTIADNVYKNLGVTFSNAIGGHVYARNGSGYAESSPNVVSIVPPNGAGGPQFNAYEGAVKASFGTLQSQVSIDARPVSASSGSGTPYNRPFLEAFDAQNHFLGEVLYQGALPTGKSKVGAKETLTFTSSTRDISYVLFSTQQTQPGPSMYGLFDNLRFNAQPASLSVTAPASVTVGKPFSITVTVRDAKGYVVNDYTGTVHFSDTGLSALLPADYTFTAADQGQHVFTITPKGTGTLALHVYDKVQTSIGGTADIKVIKQLMAASYAIRTTTVETGVVNPDSQPDLDAVLALIRLRRVLD